LWGAPYVVGGGHPSLASTTTFSGASRARGDVNLRLLL